MLGNEATMQIALFEWASYNRDLDCMYAIPNGGSRHYLEACNLKRQGLKAGVPDVCLPLARGGFHGLYIELKWGKNKPTKEQLKWLEVLSNNGYKTAVIYSIDDAIEVISDYLKLKE